MKNDNKNVHRLAPCADYDVETMEQWLIDLAAEGLFLSKDGFFVGFGTFERRQPKKVRYRLSASFEGIAALEDTRPDDEVLQLSESIGWEYICNRGQFHIYMTEDPNAPELDTDPEVRALAVDMVRKRQRSSHVYVFIWLVVYPLVFNALSVVRSAIAFGTVLFSLILIMMLWEGAASIYRIRFLRKLRRRMSAGELEYNKNWRKTAKRRHTLQALNAAGWILLVVLGMSRFVYVSKLEMPLSEYTGDVPFATLSDIIKGEYEGGVYGGNTIEELSDILAKRAIHYNENATFRQADGTAVSGGINVDYYETAAPWLAKELAHEMIRYDKIKKWRRIEEMDAPALDADFVYAYEDVFPTLILVEDNVVLRVRGYLTGMRGANMAEWGQIMLDSIKD